MEPQFYFWEPLMKKHKIELSLVEDYYETTKTPFEDIEKRAREHASELQKKIHVNENTDLSDLAEWVSEQEVELYENLLRMKSNHLLMTISLLCQTWEQQLIKFTIQEMEHSFTFTQKNMDFSEVQLLFKLHGVDIEKTNSWTKIKEMRWLVNTIKHGEGISSVKLRKIRPDFFYSNISDFLDDSIDILELNGAVLLDGYTLKVQEEDFYTYLNSVINFWDEMPERAFSDTDIIINEFGKKNKPRH
ncbi:hypothetical protein D3C76_153640 [compost metagenome]